MVPPAVLFNQTLTEICMRERPQAGLNRANEGNRRENTHCLLNTVATLWFLTC